MASLATNAELLQSVLSDLSTVTISQLAAFFRQYGDNPDFPHLLQMAFPEIVLPHASGAAMITAQWYDELAPESTYQAKPVVELPAEQMSKTVAWSLYAPGNAKPLERLSGSVKRMVFDASRDTVLANIGNELGGEIKWARYASATACAFCRMLATRGAVYRSASSAGTVVGRSVDLTTADRRHIQSGLTTRAEVLARRESYTTYQRGSRKGQEKVRRARGNAALGSKYHDHCRCIAVPVRAGTTYEPPDYVQQWEQDYMDAVGAHRAAGEEKNQFGAIDTKAVLRRMSRS